MSEPKPLRLSPDDWRRPDANFWRGRFEGEVFGTGASVIFYSTDEIGAGPPLHVHSYDEIFIVREGRAMFTVGEAEFEAKAGDILFGRRTCRIASSISAPDGWRRRTFTSARRSRRSISAEASPSRSAMARIRKIRVGEVVRLR